MYLYLKYEGEVARQVAEQRKPFGAGLSAEAAAKVERLEIWASAFTDAGEDHGEFRMWDADGKALPRVVIPGY